MTQRTHWNQTLSAEGLAALQQPGGVIVCPTKVGYIIMATDKAGLERKFDAKERKRNKPGVVLCGSMEQLRALAQSTPKSKPSTKNTGTKTSSSAASCRGAPTPKPRCRRTGATNS